MVRLKACEAKLRAASVYTFQFQYGAIKSLSISLFIAVIFFNFNSSMVRLKANLSWHDISEGGYFNSSMVRLKVSLSESETVPVFNFNSSMVRLKGFFKFFLLIHYNHFNSSMVRLKVNCELINLTINHISIPVWCD